jgi:hypothetical protein
MPSQVPTNSHQPPEALSKSHPCPWSFAPAEPSRSHHPQVNRPPNIVMVSATISGVHCEAVSMYADMCEKM